jgi:hypothetical protein
MRKLEAEIILVDPNDIIPATRKLALLGFEVYIRDDDEPDEDSNATWIKVVADSELDDEAFFHWIVSIVEPLGGNVVKAAGYQPRFKSAP